MNKLKQILSSLLAVSMCFGMFTGFSNDVYAAEEISAYMIQLPRGGDTNETGWGNDHLYLIGGWEITASLGDVGFLYGIGSYNGPIAYCIEPGVTLNSGDTFVGYDESFWENYPSEFNSTISPQIIKATIGRILQYGYIGNINTSWDSTNSDDANAIAQAIATQILIWETIVGERDSQFNHVWGSSQGKDNVIEIIKSNHPLRDLIFSYYDAMETSIQNHTKLPSFFSSSANSEAYELEWNGSEYSVTLTDSNSVMANYNFSSNTSGVDISVSSNQITISCDSAPDDNISITAEKKNGTRYGFVTWTDGNIGGGDQDLVSYTASVSDPVIGYLNLEIKTGNLKLIKTSEDGNIDGVSFTIDGQDFNEVFTTDANGEINVTGLNPGTYTVTEYESDKYIPADVQQVTIVSGQTSTVTFNNVLKRGELRVIKTSEDDIVEGVTFKLSGTSLAGITIEMYAVTDADGIAEFKDVLISGSTPYILEEINTPVCYVVPENQNVTIEWNKVTEKTVDNILKKFCVTVTKSDMETGLAQGDGTLSGAIYGIYKGNTLIDSYTTDANGQFTTDYYICGYDWSIKEINPSEGYLIDSTIYEIGAEPELYTIELNTIVNNVTEQVISGNIVLIKHTDDGSTQIETPEEGAEFEIFLKSSGSYDNAKETERDYLICDDNGYAVSKDMPYGVYIVRQTSGWEGTEMIPDFEVYIAQDGTAYQFIINNAVFESYIKIVKKDIETGNTIPYAGSGFKIYDPQGELVTMSFTYPTLTTIDTFYTNSEGYLITPEELPFGIGYTLVEVEAPYGYVLDSTPVYFDVVSENIGDDGSGINIIVVEKQNISQKGTITITKSGEVLSTVITNENIYQPSYTVQGLPGAVYEIIASEDIYTLDKTLRVSAGEVVDIITTDENGVATSKLLYLGKYTIKEITAPFGMVINDEVYNVELVYEGQEVEVTTTDINLLNDRQKINIDLYKILEADEEFNIGFNNEILDVSFGIYARVEIVALDGTVIPENGLIEVVNVNLDGKATFTTDLPVGSYYVKEITTNKSYEICDTEYDIVFEYAGQDVDVVSFEVNDGVAIENTLIRGSIQIVKQSSDGVLEGFTFRLEGVDYLGNIFSEDYITDVNGEILITDLCVGEYTIREIETDKTANYELPDAQKIIIENDNTITVNFFNELKEQAEMPQTGNSSNIFFWIVLVSISFVVFSVTIATRFINRHKTFDKEI